MPPEDFPSLIKLLLDLIDPLLILIAALSLFVFFKGLAVFIAKSGDEKTHKEGRNLMVWGIIALFVMVSFLGLISMLKKDFGFGGGTGLPTLPVSTRR